MEDNKNQYFASKEPEKVADILLDKAETFYNAMYQNEHLNKIRKSWAYYHGMFNNDGLTDHEITFTGEQGELVKLPINHYRNFAEHMITMITANRPTMDARAVNTDYKSLAQTYLANGILDYYMREKNLENVLKKAVTMAVVCSVGYIKIEWNQTAGEIYDADPETGEKQYEGEIEYSNLSALDVVVDGSKESWNNDWVLTRTFKNKYDLAAKYPELSGKIIDLKTKDEIEGFRRTFWSNDETSDVPVYEFFHKRTESMPDGRYILFLEENIVLLDTPMPYRVLPVFRITPSEIIGTPYGYTPLFDIYPLQEAINSTASAIMTNQNAFATQSLFIPTNSNIQWSALDGGMNIIEGDAPPQPINFTSTPPEVFNWFQILIQQAETLTGMNSVTRGNPEKSLKTGAALALVQSMALQYISGLQASYVKLVEEVGTATINILKDFANTPRTVALVGKHNRSLLKEFSSDDISSISRVIVDIGNPLAKTTAGRVEMAQQMMQFGVIKDPQQYLQVINTGRLDVMTEGDTSELLLIKRENELLMNAEQVRALEIDQHRQHILEHRSILNDPDLRRNEDVKNLVLDHIQEHIELLRTTNPELLMLIGEQPLSPPEPPQPSQRDLERSSVGDVTAPVQNPTQGGDSVRGIPNLDATGNIDQSLPNPAKPPGEFANLPTDPKDMIPS